ncbi:MAG: hypothetical protein ACNYWU_02755 [Desulfobacterales bacterium]
MKKLLFILLFISLIVPGLVSAAPLADTSAGYEDFYSQSGIQPSGDLNTMELGQTTFGTVMDAAQLSKLGFKDTKAGDKVQLTLLKGDKLKISVMSVKQEKIIQLKK